ncbi:Dyp-type peroxidase [Methylocella sp.]|uniref:Dyp-type peroxidase n=1 Tax=Methylocella sp. TaxID=1978226 RepID=UPI0037845990
MSAPLPSPASEASGSVRLNAPHDAQAQGLIVSGFSALPCAKALFLRFGWGAEAASAKAALWRKIQELAPISDADGKEDSAAVLAFTFTGLKALGLADAALDSFSIPFKEGMFQPDRLRRLGDRYDGEWLPSVVDGGPLWSGNVGAAAPAVVARLEAVERATEETVSTPLAIHALLTLYDATPDKLEQRAGAVEAALLACGVVVERTLALSLHIEGDKKVAREHFGFADGVSQPTPFSLETEEEGLDPAQAAVTPARRDPWNGAPLGDFLFGHRDSHHERAQGPLVADDERGRAAGLPQDGAPEGFRNLGLDGTYMVVRELRQDVAAFWRSAHRGAEALRREDPSATHVTAEWLAERIVGRTRDGHLLCPSGPLAARSDGAPRNDFGFRMDDPYGIGCPTGSHVRRANPRDGLAHDAASAPTMLASSNSHRILRRGRNYGPKVADPSVDDGAERGLLFICLNTDIARQFEFIQQNWILNPSFATLFREKDPLVGPAGEFTIREEPLRRVAPVETFVRMAGGEYFFLPSLPALNYLFTS